MNYAQSVGGLLLLIGFSFILSECGRWSGKTWSQLEAVDYRLMVSEIGCIVGGVGLLIAGRQ